jgi:hypothetical protein
MTVQQICQTMLDRYGFFVVCNPTPHLIGEVIEDEVGASYGTPMLAKFKLVAEATEDDLALQLALMGRKRDPLIQAWMYKAVAE